MADNSAILTALEVINGAATPHEEFMSAALTVDIIPIAQFSPPK